MIRKASQFTHLPYEELPPLADRDCAARLEETSFERVRNARHILFGLLHLYRKPRP